MNLERLHRAATALFLIISFSAQSQARDLGFSDIPAPTWKTVAQEQTIGSRVARIEVGRSDHSEKQARDWVNSAWADRRLPVRVERSGGWTIYSRLNPPHLQVIQFKTSEHGPTEWIRHRVLIGKSPIPDALENQNPIDLFVAELGQIVFRTSSRSAADRVTDFLVQMSSDADFESWMRARASQGYREHPLANRVSGALSIFSPEARELLPLGTTLVRHQLLGRDKEHLLIRVYLVKNKTVALVRHVKGDE